MLEGLLEDGDVCLVMGAGDVDELGRTLRTARRRREEVSR